MKSQYKNTIFVYLLLSLFITSAFASTRSVIRQFTDDFNTNPQQTEAEETRQISSRENEMSVSNIVKGFRSRVPSSYAIKMKSFNILLESSTQRHIARPFSAGGYNWTLIVYPNGNKNDNGTGYVSLYVAVDNSTFTTAQQGVSADIRFYIFNKVENKYLTIQATEVWRFNNLNRMLGFSQVMLVDTFKDPNNGYLFDNQAKFGVDVSVPTHFKSSEMLTIAEDFSDASFTWEIQKFSTLQGANYSSDPFTIEGREFYLSISPNGLNEGEGQYFSLFIYLAAKQRTSEYEEVYARGTLRVLNQRNLNNVERKIDNWFGLEFFGTGSQYFLPLTDLKDPSKGFIVDDVLKVQVELQAISTTMYFP